MAKSKSARVEEALMTRRLQIGGFAPRRLTLIVTIRSCTALCFRRGLAGLVMLIAPFKFVNIFAVSCQGGVFFDCI